VRVVILCLVLVLVLVLVPVCCPSVLGFIVNSIDGVMGLSCASLFVWFSCRHYERGAYAYQLFVSKNRCLAAARLLAVCLVLRTVALAVRIFTQPEEYVAVVLMCTRIPPLLQ